VTNSYFHRDISQQLRDMGIAHRNEEIIIPGYIVDVFISHNLPSGSLGFYMTILLYNSWFYYQDLNVYAHV
jgi:hypothetical protein